MLDNVHGPFSLSAHAPRNVVSGGNPSGEKPTDVVHAGSSGSDAHGNGSLAAAKSTTAESPPTTTGAPDAQYSRPSNTTHVPSSFA